MRYWIFDIQFDIQKVRYWIFDIQFDIQKVRYWIFDIQFDIQKVRYWISDIQFDIQKVRDSRVLINSSPIARTSPFLKHPVVVRTNQKEAYIIDGTFVFNQSEYFLY